MIDPRFAGHKYVRVVMATPGFDGQTGQSQVFNLYSPSYPSGFPAVQAGASNGHSLLRFNAALCQAFIVRKVYANGDVEEIINGTAHPAVRLAAEDAVEVPSFAKGKTLVAWWTRGYAPRGEHSKALIPDEVRLALKGKRCVFSGSSAHHIDHKYGREDQAAYPKTALVAHYQAASVTDNTRKRESCKRCKRTNERFDARVIPGIPKGWVAGGARFDHNREGCVGCYLFDPVAFREALWSEGSKPARGSKTV